MKLTARQHQVLALIVESGERGLTCRQIRDRIYPADAPMRTRRTSGRGASGHNGSVGALGNLAVGRVCATLDRLNLIVRGSGADCRYRITDAGRIDLSETQ